MGGWRVWREEMPGPAHAPAGSGFLCWGYQGGILHQLEAIQATTTLLVQPGINLRGQLRVERTRGGEERGVQCSKLLCSHTRGLGMWRRR